MTNQDGCSPLHMAALHGRTDLVPLLLKHGAYSGARNTSQAVPLHLACQQGHFQVWPHLLGSRVDAWFCQDPHLVAVRWGGVQGVLEDRAHTWGIPVPSPLPIRAAAVILTAARMSLFRLGADHYTPLDLCKIAYYCMTYNQDRSLQLVVFVSF